MIATTGSSRSRLLFVAGVALLTVTSVIIATDPTASDYEISLYDSYPLIFWISIVLAMLFGQLILLGNAKNEAESGWKRGFMLLFAANAILLFLPAFRYQLYAPGKGDVLTFIGRVRRLQAQGEFLPADYYPAASIEVATLSYATGIDPAQLFNLLPPILSLFYLATFYYLLTTIMMHRRELLYVLPFASLPLFQFENLMFTPSLFAFFFLPFVLLLLLKRRAWNTHSAFGVLLVLSVVGIVFFHPLTTVFLIMIFALTKTLRMASDQSVSVDLSNRTPVLVVGSIGFVLFFSWYYSFESIIGSTSSVIERVFVSGAVGSSEFGQVTSTAARTSPAIVDLIRTGVYTYGVFAALAGMGLFFVCYRTLLFVRDNSTINPYEIFFSAVFLLFAGLSITAYFVDITVGFTRISRYVRFAAPILIGFGLASLYNRTRGSSFGQAVQVSACVACAILVFLSIFTLYGSPLSNEYNAQITESELQGMEWMLDNREPTLLIDELGTDHYRFYTLFNGGRLPQFDPSAQTIRRGLGTPPDHFAYGNASAVLPPSEVASLPDEANVSLGQRYLLVTELGQLRNPTFYPDYRRLWRHTPSDFDRLQRDPRANQVYDNGEFESYVIETAVNRTRV